MSESLRSLRGNKQPRANRSGRSRQLSNPEQFAHFLFFGERPERLAHDRSFPLSHVSESLISLKSNERCEQMSDHMDPKFPGNEDNKKSENLFDSVQC